MSDGDIYGVAGFDQRQAEAIELLRSTNAFFFVTAASLEEEHALPRVSVLACLPAGDEWREWLVRTHREIAAHMLATADALEADG